MIKRIFFILVIPVVLYSCSKSGDTVANNCVSTGGVPTTAEIAEVQTYLTSKGLTATKDTSGLFYNIVSMGYGTQHPFVTSNVTANYKGSLKDGTVFDSTVAGTPVLFNLSSVIKGWTIGVPLITKGGIIDLYIPASLAYGCSPPTATIPQNAMLIFRIELVFF